MKLRPLHLSLALAWAVAGSAQAQSLLAHTRQFLQTQFPDLLATPKKTK